MKTFVGFRPGLVLALQMIALTCAYPVKASTVVIRAQAFIDGATYQLDVVEEWRPVNQTSSSPSADSANERPPKHPEMDLFRELSIRCIDRCKSPTSYREEIFDSPISAFTLWDGSHELTTIWAGGSTYRVRIYRIDNGRIGKVLEQSTKSAPQFGFAADGSPVAALQNPDSLVPRRNLQIRGQLWKWNGTQYRPVGGPTKGEAAIEDEGQ